MSPEPLGRPKTLNRRHIIEIKADTREWMEEQLDGIKAAFVAGKAVRAAGETAKGILGHPIGFAAVALPIIAFVVAMLIKRAEEQHGDEAPGLKQQYEDWEEAFINAWTGPIRQLPGGEALIGTWLRASRAIRDTIASIIPKFPLGPTTEEGIPEVLKPFFPPEGGE